MAPSLASIPNFRDAGGLPTADGRRTRPGLMWRSAHLSEATDEDLAMLAELGVRTVIDLRTDSDVVGDGGVRLPSGAERLHHPVGDIGVGQVDVRKVLMSGDPDQVRATFGDGKAMGYMHKGATFYASDPKIGAAVAETARCLVDPARHSLLVHCSAGKDRTGWTCAAIQLALGATRAAIVENYTASNDPVRIQHLLAGFTGPRGIDPEFVRPFLEVRAEYIESSLAEMERLHGSIDSYLEAHGVTASELAALREVALA